jgi:hypothetical protein
MSCRRIEAGMAPISCYATRYSAVAEAATELSSSIRPDFPPGFEQNSGTSLPQLNNSA